MARAIMDLESLKVIAIFALILFGVVLILLLLSFLRLS